VDDRERKALRLRRELVAEVVGKKRVDDGVQPLLGETIPVVF